MPKTTKAENRQGSTQQAGRTKEKERGEGGGGRGEEKAHGTQPWHAKEQTAQSRTGNKAKTQQRDTWSRTALGRNKHTPEDEARGREGVGGERRKKEEERKRTGKEGGGCPKLRVLHPWARQGEEGRCTQLYCHIQDHTTRGGEGVLPSCPWPMSSVVWASTLIRLLHMLLRSVELLLHVATSPCGCWFLVPHKVECLCLRRLLLLYSKYRRLQVVKFTTHSEYGKMPAHGYSVDRNQPSAWPSEIGDWGVLWR